MYTLLNQKKLAFKKGDKERLRELQYELKEKLRQAKVDYKREVESKLQQNIRQMWKRKRNLTGYSKKNCQVMDGEVFTLSLHSSPLSHLSPAAAVPAPLSPGSSLPPTTNYHCPLQQTR